MNNQYAHVRPNNALFMKNFDEMYEKYYNIYCK